MKKIYIPLLGGLGNQLYQIAFGYALMQILPKQIYFDTSRFQKYKDHKLVVDKLFPEFCFCELRRNFLMNRVNENSISFDQFLMEKIIDKSKYRNVQVNGYFQSLAYFSPYLCNIKKILFKRIKILNPELNNLNLKDKLKDTLGIHIRRGNKTNKSNIQIYGIRSIDEIIKNIEYIFNNNSYSSILLLGDDREYLKSLQKRLNSMNAKIYFTSDFFKKSCEILDFYFLTEVKDLMITNSTFSLWAGYLKQNGKVFFPKPFYPYPLHKSILKHNLEDIIFPDWISYKVNF